MRGDTVLETERLVVRHWRETDLDRVFDIYRRWEVSQWLGAEPRAVESREAAERMLERWTTSNGDGESGRWAVERKADGVVAGTVIWLPLPGGVGEHEVGWHLHPDSWGHGYAAEAGRAVVQRGFGRGFEEAYAVVRPGNGRSVAVCLRLGMEPLGLTDRYYSTTLELFRLCRAA